MRVRLLIAAAMLLIAPLATAQTVGPELSPERPVLYAHAVASDTSILYLNSLRVTEDEGAYNGGVQSPGEGVDAWTRTFVMSSPLSAPVALDPSGKVHVEIFVGGSTSNGRVDLTWALKAGELEIAKGPSKTATFVSEYVGTSWDVTPSVSEIPAGSTITFEFKGTGARTGAFVSVGERGTHGTTGRPFGGETRVELPVVASTTGPTLLYGNLTEPASTHDFVNATSDIYILNFTSALANGTAAFSWNATNGNVTAVLTDAAGAEVYNGTFSGNGTERADFAGAALGNWTLSLAYDNFAGAMFFSLLAPGSNDDVDPGQGGSGNGGSTGDGDTDNGSDDDTGDDTGNETLQQTQKESPGVPLFLVLTIVAIAALRRRR